MENGDLAVSVRPHIVVVLEGVLADLTPVEQHRRLRADKLIGYNFHWHDVPLKRIAYMKRHWPDTAVDVVTFVSQDVCDEAAEFFDRSMITVDTCEYHTFSSYVSVLPYQQEVTMVVDTSAERLDQYGQLGRATVRGADFG